MRLPASSSSHPWIPLSISRGSFSNDRWLAIDRSIDRSFFNPARPGLLLGSLDSAVRATRSKPKREEATFRVTYEVIFHDRSSRTHTHMVCVAGHMMLSLSLSLSLSFSTSSYVRSDIQIAAERAKPALNGTGSNDDVVRSSKIVHGDQNLYLWPVPTDTFRFKDDTCTLREIVSRCICGWNASNWPIAKAGH